MLYKKDLNFLVIVLFHFSLLNLLENTVGIQLITESPCWKENTEAGSPTTKTAAGKCISSLDSLIMCDPDNLLKHAILEEEHQENQVTACRNDMESKELKFNGTKQVLVYVNEIDESNVQGKKDPMKSMDKLEKCLQERFNLTSQASLLVIVKWKMFDYREWYSDLLLNGRSYTTNPKKDPNYKKLYYNEDVQTSVTLAMTRMCQILHEIQDGFKGLKTSTYLWIVLVIIMGGGLICFGCWIYRFNKSHPVDEVDQTEMTMMEQSTKDGTPASEIILTKDNVIGISPVAQTSQNVLISL